MGNGVCYEEVLEAVTDQAESGTGEEDKPEGQVDSGDAGYPTEEFSGVGSEGEVVELELGEGEELLELRRVSREVGVGSVYGLKPYRPHKAKPLKNVVVLRHNGQENFAVCACTSTLSWPLGLINFVCLGVL